MSMYGVLRREKGEGLVARSGWIDIQMDLENCVLRTQRPNTIYQFTMVLVLGVVDYSQYLPIILIKSLDRDIS